MIWMILFFAYLPGFIIFNPWMAFQDARGSLKTRLWVWACHLGAVVIWPVCWVGLLMQGRTNRDLYMQQRRVDPFNGTVYEAVWVSDHEVTLQNVSPNGRLGGRGGFVSIEEWLTWPL